MLACPYLQSRDLTFLLKSKFFSKFAATSQLFFILLKWIFSAYFSVCGIFLSAFSAILSPVEKALILACLLGLLAFL